MKDVGGPEVWGELREVHREREPRSRSQDSVVVFHSIGNVRFGIAVSH